jgi:hypothetical protein
LLGGLNAMLLIHPPTCGSFKGSMFSQPKHFRTDAFPSLDVRMLIGFPHFGHRLCCGDAVTVAFPYEIGVRIRLVNNIG